MSFKKEKRQETIIYLVLWGLFFIAPVVTLYLHTTLSSNEEFQWREVFMVWRRFGIYFAFFLVHNHLVAPLMVYSQKRTAYCAACAALVVLFVGYQMIHQPTAPGMHRHEAAETFDGHHGPPPPDAPHHDSEAPLHGRGPRHGEPPHNHPLYGERDVVAIVLLLLMFGMNMGVKLHFKHSGDRKKLERLEHENLEQQLTYLKFQLNPHFLMNTLNNIHALVDIDAEEAKTSIIELSKILRFVLYEGDKPTVPLSRELSFMDDYIRLMRMRVSDDVPVNVSFPTNVPDVSIPPLLLITYVENAFKHGISYSLPSFIDIRVTLDNEATRLHFTCRNSRIPASEDHHGGVGLTNARRRLDLIFGSNYRLDIKENEADYTVSLDIPIIRV